MNVVVCVQAIARVSFHHVPAPRPPCTTRACGLFSLSLLAVVMLASGIRFHTWSSVVEAPLAHRAQPVNDPRQHPQVGKEPWQCAVVEWQPRVRRRRVLDKDVEQLEAELEAREGLQGL